MLKDPNVIKFISSYVLQTFLSVYRQHPQWLNEKYRRYPWHNQEFKVEFSSKLVEKLRQTKNQKQLLNYLLIFLRGVLSSEFFSSFEYSNLIVKINKVYSSSVNINNLYEHFSLLLMDVENLTIDREAEKFLVNICGYPLKIKLAFANWKQQGKKDLELHSRNYELIHVPPGKNHADFKMIDFGKFIITQYPQFREVFVVSSDTDLDNLCEHLITQGLTVYRVRRQDNIINVFNSKTEQTYSYFLNPAPIMPPLDDFINQVKEIIREEQLKTNKNWIKIGRVYQLFKSKYKLDIPQVLAHYFPGEKSKNVWSHLKTDFVIHYLDNSNHVYLSIFDGVVSKEIAKKYKNIIQINQDTKVNDLQSTLDLEIAICKIVEDIIDQSNQEYIILGEVATQFQKQYQTSITKVMRRFNLGNRFPKLIESYPQLKIEKFKNNYQVGISNNQ